MRKIDWEKPLSEDDITWLRQAGIPGIEERIQRHQEEVGGEVPELEQTEDTLTQSALDREGRARGERIATDSGPIDTTPTPGADVDTSEDDEGDDYDSWKVSELRDEVIARNKIASEQKDVTEVRVDGTGKEGAITKQDVVKALRVWDDENPGVLEAANKD